MQKPKLLIIRASLDNLSDHFKDAGFYNRERGLEVFFDVTVLENRFDLKKEIGLFEPDLVAFIYDPCSQGGCLKITNVDYRLDIPRILIPILDAYSLYRWNVFLVFKEIKATAIFTYDTSFGEYYPSLVNDTYQWHEFVDINIFKNYFQTKECDILLAGSFIAKNYPWRRKVLPLIKKFNYRELIHWERDRPEENKKTLVKEGFSMLLNKAKIVPTCGGHSKIILGKHFEISASFSCLVTEKSEALEIFGFEDGVNCLMADENDFEKKVSHLLKNQTELDRITQNGFDFIRNNHTANNRSEIADWFILNKSKAIDQKIIQSLPLKNLKCVNIHSDEKNYFVKDVPPVKLTETGDVFLLSGNALKAQEIYKYFDEIDQDSSNVIIRKVLLCVFNNKLNESLSQFSKIIEHEMEIGHAEIIDPIELFAFCIILFRKKEYELIIALCEFEEAYLKKLESNSLHLSILRALSEFNFHKKQVELNEALENYKFCSSHEFLNINYDKICNFLIKIGKLNTEEIKFLASLKFFNKSTKDKQPSNKKKIKDRSEFVGIFKNWIYKPSLIQKILHKLKIKI